MSYAPLPAQHDLEAPLLSTAPLDHDLEKSALAHTDSNATPLQVGQNSASRHRKAKLLLVAGSGALLLLVSSASLALFCQPDTLSSAWERFSVGCSSSPSSSQEREGHGGAAWKWWKRALGDTEYSTSTHTRGGTYWTSTYVKTTRPIVNPGGFTIGTLTGYVIPSNASSSAASASATATASATSSSSSAASAASSSDAEESPSDTTQYYVAPVSSTSSDEGEDEDEAGATTTVTETTTTTQLSTTTETVTSTITAAPSPSSQRLAKRAPSAGALEEEWDFGPEVEAHLLHRRGENFERAVEGEEQGGEEEGEESGKEELSTSTNRRGGVVTLVKTTRPILNPAGFTVGTLSGAWVDVAKQTDRTVSSVSTIPASASVSSGAAPAPTAAQETEKEKRRHEELRRRSEA